MSPRQHKTIHCIMFVGILYPKAPDIMNSNIHHLKYYPNRYSRRGCFGSTMPRVETVVIVKLKRDMSLVQMILHSSRTTTGFTRLGFETTAC